MKSSLVRFTLKFLSISLFIQALSLDVTHAGPKLLLQDEILTTQHLLAGHVSTQEENRLTTYLQILLRMNRSESDLGLSDGIRKHPGQISLNLKNRILKATDFFNNNSDDLFQFLDQLERDKKNWKQEAEKELLGVKVPEYHLVQCGSRAVKVTALNHNQLCIDTGTKIGAGSFSNVTSTILYKTWESAALILGKKVNDEEGKQVEKNGTRKGKFWPS